MNVHIKKTIHPVSTIRYTPFGNGLITIEQDQNDLTLWSIKDDIDPIHILSGHKDAVKHFDFRYTKDYGHQLVSWGKDGCLKLWTFDSQLREVCFSFFSFLKL